MVKNVCMLEKEPFSKSKLKSEIIFINSAGSQSVKMWCFKSI